MRKLGPDFGDRKYLETKWINFRFGHGRFVSILLVKVSGLKKWLILWILDSLRRKRDFFFFLVDLDYIYGRLSRIWRVFIRYINYLKILILELNDGRFANLRSIYENVGFFFLTFNSFFIFFLQKNELNYILKFFTLDFCF